MSRYPLTESLGLEVSTNYLGGSSWGMVRACDLEALLAKAPVVKSFDMPDFKWYCDGYPNEAPTEYTHTALLVGIKPLVRDTAESLLREMTEKYANAPWAYVNNELVERARKLLRQGEG